MLDKLKNFFKKPEPVKEEVKTEKPKKKLTPKEEATLKGEPYVNIIGMELDPNDIHNGSFELDWNDKFIINLIKSGYKMKDDEPDNVIVDRWFQTVCRNIALEMYEQQVADPANRDMRNVVTKNLGNGRTEVS
jgi:TPP-dependent 2-oxoacid decarboxylase